MPSPRNLSPSQFEHAGRERRRLASELFGSSKGLDQARLQVASYLVHIAVECVFKARLLTMRRATRMQMARTTMSEEEYKSIFESARGHDLRHLSTYVSLGRLLAAENREVLVQTPAWRRMCAPDRPYSLRYGTGPELTQDDILREIDLADEIASIVERNL